MDVHRDIPLSLRAPTEARHVIDGLASALPSKVLDDLRLIVTELVANSVKHSGLRQGDPIALRVHASPERVHVEVADVAGGGFSPVARHPGVFSDSGGWGLYLLDRLADRWGQVPGDGVWAEVDLPSPESRLIR